MFLKEAPQGWQRYAKAFQLCSIDEQNKYVDAAGEVNSSNTSHLHWLGPDRAVCFSTLDDGTKWISCRREDYAFWISRKNDAEPWDLNLLLKTTDLQASHYPSRALRRSFYPDFLFRQDSLLEAIQKPHFKLLSVEHTSTDIFPNLYKVIFDYEHPYACTKGDYQYNWVQNGTLWLDADNCWAIARFRFEMMLNNGKREWLELEFDFDRHHYRGVRLPSRCSHFDLDSKWQRKVVDEWYVREFRRTEPIKADSNALNLSHYGFAEPDFRSSAQVIQIQVDTQSEIDVGRPAIVPFSVQNVGDQVVTIIRVAAC